MHKSNEKSAIRRPFEVYGADDYCGDLYRPGMTPDQLRARIDRKSVV